MINWGTSYKFSVICLTCFYLNSPGYGQYLDLNGEQEEEITSEPTPKPKKKKSEPTPKPKKKKSEPEFESEEIKPQPIERPKPPRRRQRVERDSQFQGKNIFDYLRVRVLDYRVFLNWKYIWEFEKERKFREYSVEIYRTKSIPSSTGRLALDNLIAKMPSYKKTHIDIPKEFGEPYYYTILIKRGNLLLKQNLEINKNYVGPTSIPFDYKESKSLEGFSEIFSSVKIFHQNSSIVISWQYTKEFRNSPDFEEYKIEVYRFREVPDVIDDLVYSKLIASLFAEQSLFDDTPEKRGRYFYALFLRRNRELYPKIFKRGKNLAGPVDFRDAPHASHRPPPPISRPPQPEPPGSGFTPPTSDPEPPGSGFTPSTPTPKPPESSFTPPASYPESSFSNVSLHEILKNHFYQKDYRNTISKLKAYETSIDRKLKGMALFYVGLSFFRIEQFKESATYFLHPDVLKYDKARAKFWYRRALKEIDE